MNIFIVDDSNDKIANVISCIREISPDFLIDSAFNYINAIKKLSINKYDLLISDLVIPIRENEIPVEDGGYKLINEIDRISNIQSPNYIVGLTQYPELKHKFSNIWNVLTYSSSNDDWKTVLRKIIQHINKTTSCNSQIILEKKPTIFFEGHTDEKIFKEAIKIFNPDIESKIIFKSENSAGANWVARQILVWAFSLLKDANKNYIKCVGILDCDNAGKSANMDINRKIDSTSAESTTFRIFKLKTNYARDLIPLYQKGVNIPITLEEMFNPNLWNYAEKEGWLELRQNPDSFLSDPKGWDKYNVTLKDHIASLGLNVNEQIYLNKFKDECKDDFCNYIIGLNDSDKKNALINFKKLIEDIKEYLISK
jgi:hypothetical protein